MMDVSSRVLTGKEREKVLKMMDAVMRSLAGTDCIDRLQVLSVLTGTVLQHLLDHHLNEGTKIEDFRPTLLKAVMLDIRNGMGLAEGMGAWDEQPKAEVDLSAPRTFLGTSGKNLVH